MSDSVVHWNSHGASPADQGFPRDWEDRAIVEVWLSKFLAEFDGRAAGLWRMDRISLTCLGLAFAADFPADVAVEFRDATQSVRLSQLGLGIVKAAVNRETALSTVVDGPEGSRGWLRRFGAYCSIAVPAAVDNEVVGVLSVAVPEPTDARGEAEMRVCGHAERIAPFLPSHWSRR